MTWSPTSVFVLLLTSVRVNVLVTSIPWVRDKEVTVGSFSVLPSKSSPSSLTPCTVPEIPPGEVYEAVNVTELEISGARSKISWVIICEEVKVVVSPAGRAPSLGSKNICSAAFCWVELKV